jgi:hypothetical protein
MVVGGLPGYAECDRDPVTDTPNWTTCIRLSPLAAYIARRFGVLRILRMLIRSVINSHRAPRG